MGNTIPGGAYLADDGVTYIDAEGKPLSKEQVKELEKLQAAHAAEVEAAASVEMNSAELAVARKLGLVFGPALEAQPVAKHVTAKK